MQRWVDDLVVVSEEEIASAILALLEREKTVAEGAVATWTNTNLVCSKGTVDLPNRSASIALLPGDVVTCTVTGLPAAAKP